jgi:hypothetical protein
MKELLSKLGLSETGDYGKDNVYTVDLKDSDEYGKVYSKLDKSEEFYEIEDSSLLTIHNSSIVYENDKYEVILISDFDQDTYKLTIKEK